MSSHAVPPEGVSTSGEPYQPGLLKRFYDKITGKVAVRHPWSKLPKDLSLAELIGIRDTLRRENLFDTSRLPSVDPAKPPPCDEAYLTARTADDSRNELEHPEMGMAGTRFGRNVPLKHTWPDQDRVMRKVDFQMCLIFEFDGESMTNEKVYFDLSTPLRQLGTADDYNSPRGKLAAVLGHPAVIIEALVFSLTYHPEPGRARP